jgi:class 3 adenylate cyclase
MASCTQCGAPLPPEARFCPSCAAPVSKAASSGEERKVATVLFADLVGSTALGAEQDPERTRVLLERFYDAMASEIDSAEGTLEKFAGDAVMAAFGAPSAQEDHAERALHAALAMRRRVKELFGEGLQLRIGVNTGEVVVGPPRERSSFVTGDAVNVAARLERAAAPDEILVGERTVAAAGGAFEFGESARIEAKGKAEGVICRKLIRALTLMRPRGVGGLRRAFVGREAELELLQATFERVRSQAEPHLVTIMGDSGVGKSRLVRELWEWLGGRPEAPLRRTGRCLPYGQGITYWPLGEVLKEHLGILETDSPERVRESLGAREVLGLTLGLDLKDDLHPLAVRERLHEAWIEFLEELASEGTTVLLLEDLHWAEEPLLDLVERLVRDVQGPMLIVATGRPELLDRRPTWGGGRRNTSTLWLEPLPPGDTTRLLEELLAAELPAALRERIVEQAEGNPFFVEELLGSLIDHGYLEREDGGWRVSALPEGFDVPDSVRAVLAARIDLLGPVEKSALQAAAVIGRVFWEGPVRELLDGAAPRFELLEERDFIRRRHGSSIAGDREYAVKHALTREVAYDSLPKAKRARLHARFAQWIEQLGENREDLVAVLAHHYAEATRAEDADLAWANEPEALERLRPKAAEWLRRAGQAARGRYAMEDAVRLLTRALDYEDSPAQTSLLWREIGLAHALRYDGEAFWTAMERSVELCGDRATCADSYSQLAFQTAMRSGMWPSRPEARIVDEWIEHALERAEPGTSSYVRAMIARAASHWNDEQGAPAAREAAVLAEELGDPELRSWAWEVRARTSFVSGAFEEACTWAERRFEFEPLISDPDHLTEMREAAAPAAAALGRLREARRLADEHLERSRTLSPHHRLHGTALHVEIAEVAGDWDVLLGLEDRVLAAVGENLDTPCIRNQRCLLLSAAAREYAGDADRAAELERHAETSVTRGHGFALDPARVRLALARGDLERATSLLDRTPLLSLTFGLGPNVTRLDALAALRDRDRLEREAPPLMRRVVVTEPYAKRALGLVREDETLVREAVDGFERYGLKRQAAETRALL